MKKYLFPLLLSLLVLGTVTSLQAEGSNLPDQDIQLVFGVTEYLPVEVSVLTPAYGIQFLYLVSYSGRTGSVVVTPRAGLSYSQLARARLKEG
jgi:hypothetical protein